MNPTQGIVITGTNNFFNVEDTNGIIRRCSLKGKRLKPAIGFHNPLAPGDRVMFEPDIHDDKEGQIIDIVPRKNIFIRLNEKSNTPQIIAANIDLLLCFTTPENPPFRPRFVDRVLVQAAAQHIPVLIIINKIDLKMTPPVLNRINEWRNLNYEVMEVSAKTKDGVNNLIHRISGLTISVIGQSGVGKSSLLNTISPSLNLKTAEISKKENRGNHTTIQGEYFKITTHTNDGKTHKINLIDTPGIRHFALSNISSENIAIYFPEMEPFLGKCKFGLSCSHEHESDCKIIQRLNNNKIHPDRYESWLNIKNEIIERTKDVYD